MRTKWLSDPKIKVVAALIIWLLLWECGARYLNRSLYLPTLSETLTALLNIVRGGDFSATLAASAGRVAGGFLLAVAVAVVTGVTAGFSRWVAALLYPMVLTIGATPVMSFIILAMIWFPSGKVPVFIGFLMAYPVLYNSVLGGMQRVDRGLLEMARVFRVRRRDQIRRIYLPTVMHFLTPSMVAALSLTWKVVVAAEVLSTPKLAIGSHLLDAKVYLETPELFAWTLVVVVFSLLFDVVLKWAVRMLRREG